MQSLCKKKSGKAELQQQTRGREVPGANSPFSERKAADGIRTHELLICRASQENSLFPRSLTNQPL